MECACYLQRKVSAIGLPPCRSRVLFNKNAAEPKIEDETFSQPFRRGQETRAEQTGTLI